MHKAYLYDKHHVVRVCLFTGDVVSSKVGNERVFCFCGLKAQLGPKPLHF